MHILQPCWLKLLEHLRLRRWVGRLLGALEPRQLRKVWRLLAPPGDSPGRVIVGVPHSSLPIQGWAPADATGTDLLLPVRQHPRVRPGAAVRGSTQEPPHGTTLGGLILLLFERRGS